MRFRYWVIWFLAAWQVATGQEVILSRKVFFEADTAVPTVYLSASFKGIDLKKALEERRPAHVKMVFPDSSTFEGDIEIRARGDFRFENCDPPPLMLHFKTPGAGALAGLGKLKLVWSCENNEYNEQLLLKEYLAYRIYNIITPYSFRVRRLRVYYTDINKPVHTIFKNAFLLEDIDELAKRLGCRELEGVKIPSARIEKFNYTILAIYQYMIGNTDWSIPAYHNMKLIIPRDTSLVPIPYAIPYDLDYCGLVNAKYAIPNDILPISQVRERLYMGVVNDPVEINRTIDLFMEKKREVIELINGMDGLSDKTRKEAVQYIREFYDIIANRKKAMDIFMNPPPLNHQP
jgi:hypothetical protein